ncbi:MAG TPA: EAL domain-containing protein [Abditibacteriaceae bacterium]
MNVTRSFHLSEFFEMLFQQAPDATVLMDISTPAWNIVECNEAFCRMNGFAREQLIGQPIGIVHGYGAEIHDSEVAYRSNLLRLIRLHKMMRHEGVHRKPDGSHFPVEVKNSLIELDGHEFLMGVDRDISGEKEMEQVRRSEEGFRTIYERCPDAMNLIDSETRIIVDCNEAFCQMNGYTREELVGQHQSMVEARHELWIAARANDQPLVDDILAGTFTGMYDDGSKTAPGMDFGVRNESYHQHKDGTIFPIAYVASEVIIDGRPVILGIDRDITQQRLAQHLQRDTGNILESIAQGQPLQELMLAIVGLIERQNPALHTAVLTLEGGCVHCQAGPRLPEALLDYVGSLCVQDEGVACSQTLRAIADNCFVVLDDLTQFDPHSPVCRKHSEIALEHGLKACWFTPVASRSGGVLGFFATYLLETGLPSKRDTALLARVADLAAIAIEHASMNAQLAYSAQHDALTGLPNRVLFADRLEQALHSSARRNEQAAVMFLDLDGFKQVNDTLGHHFGDELLQQVAQRLKQAVRATDTVSRMGGDEFTVILTDLTDTLHTDQIALKLLKAIEAPFMVRDHELFVTVSIGIALFPRDGADSPTLQSHADAAMYRAKSAGKNTYEYFEPGISEALREREELKDQLRRALENSEFEVLYQPQFSLKSGTVAGFEALLRWKHPQLGVTLPASFLPVAEETGLAMQIGAWMMEEACKQAKAWSASGYEIKMALDISTLQCGRTEFATLVAQALRCSDLPPHLLELELAESNVMRNVEEAVRQAKRLRQLGVRIALNGFGTGYSGLAYLKHLPANAVKIDCTFMCRHDARPLLEAVISQGHGLSLCVMVEGVENEEQQQMLHEMGCDVAQGFHLGHPMTGADATEFLQNAASIP